MNTECLEFAPLELDRATELQEVINRAAREKKAVTINPDRGGVTGAEAGELISPTEKVNGLVRYQRHY
jgi:hypothetical protein